MTSDVFKFKYIRIIINVYALALSCHFIHSFLSWTLTSALLFVCLTSMTLQLFSIFLQGSVSNNTHPSIQWSTGDQDTSWVTM